MPLGQRAIAERPMREDWETPASIFDPLHAEFNFTLDGAATAHNTKLDRWSHDAFEADWSGERVWLNPPYGADNLAKWIKKAYAESQRGAIVVCLVPSYTDHLWWHNWVVNKASEIRWIKGRVTFIGAPRPSPFPSCILVYRGSKSKDSKGEAT